MPTLGEGKEFAYSRVDFEKVRELLYHLTGIRLADSKDSMVYSRLVRRLRTLKLPGFQPYLQYVANHEEEIQFFINALTTNLTAFFREAHHFKILHDYLLTHPVKRIWCAASSTGEEPYSIAMTVVEAQGRFGGPIEIIASDIDSGVLQTAAAGIYPLDRIKDIDEQRRKMFFQKGTGKQAGKVRVVPELARMVQYQRINLMDDKWPIHGPFEVIFCRNVMIYFDKETQLEILAKMVALMPEGGLYVAGHSENFSHAPNLVKHLGKTTYAPVKRG
ncbi:chemotaxis protein CheR [Aliiglaciecola sp. CAU 1673]|uniref:CheR family methyltransferase n=1 Tax=Aliiglaciecola sp. CAU 1673 TaxID=3032595 RepID=UPI0023D9BDC5|nr:CheR family methyltransferase [Aliiglaciecola sp. CAU 1673]MDF2177097.1 chemotaxis protein CheR [Aliiglaciecola sp. CAU 1673]